LTAIIGRLPSCANGQHPKLDKVGRPIQCLPGSSSRSVCGVNHTCFFSGMNYMCCPSNEPSHDNQPACPSPLLTVLDSHGLPLKCNPRSRICPQEKGTCSDVGLAYICCEHVADELHSNSVVARDRKRAPQKKSLMKAAVDAEESLDCPQNSIGLLNGDGSRVMCNSRRRCPGESTFCHGAFKRSICCEPFEFASNVLDSVENITTSKLVKSLETFSEFGICIHLEIMDTYAIKRLKIKSAILIQFANLGTLLNRLDTSEIRVNFFQIETSFLQVKQQTLQGGQNNLLFQENLLQLPLIFLAHLNERV
uniref:WAP domain-containing protein n=1 Tax=Heligmosomoides polygyrus TaxID=6339 RepID=A0A183GAZ3_HELPZ